MILFLAQGLDCLAVGGLSWQSERLSIHDCGLKNRDTMLRKSDNLPFNGEKRACLINNVSIST